MRPRIIKTETEYRQALQRIDQLIDAEPDTPEGDELELWSMVVEAYEAVHYPILPPDPIEAIRFRMEQLKLRPVDLAPYLGGRSRVSEVLNGKRGLSIAMITALWQGLGIPLESLIPERRSAGRSPVSS